MKLMERVYLVGSGAVGVSHAGDCHVYLLDGGGELALIDAGCGEDTGRLAGNVAAEGFDPAAISWVLLTHSHRDHAGGCAAWKSRLPGARIVASAEEARLLAEGTIPELGLDVLGLAGQPRDQVFPRCSADHIARDGETLRIGATSITAIETPGHNPGCLCYLAAVNGRRVLFSGDVVHPGGVIGLGNWLGCDLQAYRRHLRKLAGLNVDALLSGHLLWTISGGQAHIDRAIAAFDGLWPPPNIHLVP